MRFLSLAYLLFNGVCAAADVSGVWNATMRMPDGTTHQSTLNLQENGDKLTGKIVSKRGSVEIASGAISDNKISFVVTRVGNGDELRVEFRGTLEGDTMRLQMQYRDHDPLEMIAKRSSGN